MAYDPERSFGFLLHDIARLMRKKFDQRARGLGLSRAQWQLLLHLSRHEGINQSRLAEILEIENITLPRLVDRMEEACWRERPPRPSRRHAAWPAASARQKRASRRGRSGWAAGLPLRCREVPPRSSWLRARRRRAGRPGPGSAGAGSGSVRGACAYERLKTTFG